MPVPPMASLGIIVLRPDGIMDLRSRANRAGAHHRAAHARCVQCMGAHGTSDRTARPANARVVAGLPLGLAASPRAAGPLGEYHLGWCCRHQLAEAAVKATQAHAVPFGICPRPPGASTLRL